MEHIITMNYRLNRPSRGKHHVYFNANPKKKEVDDCVIRALALAFDETWLVMFDDLTAIARKQSTVLNYKDCYEEYLKEHNAEPIQTMKKGQRKRIHGGDFAREHRTGRYVLCMAGHLTACVEGCIYDTWDCTQKMVYKAWKTAD